MKSCAQCHQSRVSLIRGIRRRVFLFTSADRTRPHRDHVSGNGVFWFHDLYSCVKLRSCGVIPRCGAECGRELCVAFFIYITLQFTLRENPLSMRVNVELQWLNSKIKFNKTIETTLKKKKGSRLIVDFSNHKRVSRNSVNSFTSFSCSPFNQDQTPKLSDGLCGDQVKVQ